MKKNLVAKEKLDRQLTVSIQKSSEKLDKLTKDKDDLEKKIEAASQEIELRTHGLPKKMRVNMSAKKRSRKRQSEDADPTPKKKKPMKKAKKGHDDTKSESPTACS